MGKALGLARSGLLLLWGIARHFWALLVGFTLPLYEILRNAFDWSFDLPDWLVWSGLGLGVFMATVQTYHEARTSRLRFVPQSAAAPEAEQRRGQRALFDEHIAVGNVIRAACLRPDPVGNDIRELEGRVHAWLEEARDLIQAAAPDSVGQFMVDGPGQRLPKGVPREAGRLWIFMGYRLERLLEIKNGL